MVRRKLARFAVVAVALVLGLVGLSGTPALAGGPPAVSISALIDYAGTATNVLTQMGLAFVAACGVILAIVIARKAISMFRGG